MFLFKVEDEGREVVTRHLEQVKNLGTRTYVSYVSFAFLYYSIKMYLHQKDAEERRIWNLPYPHMGCYTDIQIDRQTTRSEY